MIFFGISPFYLWIIETVDYLIYEGLVNLRVELTYLFLESIIKTDGERGLVRLFYG